MDENKKYYLNDIFQRFIKPYFSINNYVIYFEWNEPSELYKYVVTPQGDLSKFISFFLSVHRKEDDADMTIVYTNVDEFNNHNTRKLTFLLPYDDIARFNSFYMDFVNELDEKSLEVAHPEIIRPVLPHPPVIPGSRN